MDSFQGSSPRKFISFCLENPREENCQTPDPALVQVPTGISDIISESKSHSDQQTTSREDGSDEDINAYADNIVRLKEGSILSGTEHTVDTGAQAKQVPDHTTVGLNEASQIRTSTPVPVSQGDALSTSLTSLESALRVTTTAGSSWPELVPVTIPLVREHSFRDTTLRSEDTKSSVYEVPALPGLAAQKIPPTEMSETEKTEDEISRLEYQHAQNVTFGDTESGTEGGEESDPSTRIIPQAESQSSGHVANVPVQELSGRSRAIPKQFFDETPSFYLPVGHPTVAFSEPQLYHLLRTLTNETLSQSFTTMKKMVLGAVRGAPTTAQSRTDHFRSRHRARTPYLHMDSDISEAGTESDLCSGRPVPGSSGTSAGGDMTTSYEQSDTAGKMALIAESFQKSTAEVSGKHSSSTRIQASSTNAGTFSEMSCPDETLSAIKEAAIDERTNIASQSKKVKRKPRTIQRGVPMREEFFSKIGWTRSFISGPADPLHNPCMV